MEYYVYTDGFDLYLVNFYVAYYDDPISCTTLIIGNNTEVKSESLVFVGTL